MIFQGDNLLIARLNLLDNPLADKPVMDHILLLRGRKDWHGIDRFMGREYLGAWLDYNAMHSQKENV